MDRFLFCYNGNKYRETNKYILPNLTMDMNDDKKILIIEPFAGIFGFSRAIYNRYKNNCVYLLSDIDEKIINEFNEMKNNLKKYIDDIETEFNGIIDNPENVSKDNKYIKFTDNTPFKIKLMAMGINSNNGMIDKGKAKLKNFRNKIDDYQDFLSKCIFINYDSNELLNNLDDIINKYYPSINKKIIFFDSPYFDSNNKGYDKYSATNRKDKYIDGTTIYAEIFKHLERTNNRDDILNILIVNKLDFFDYILTSKFPSVDKIEILGKYQKTKNLKSHIVYVF